MASNAAIARRLASQMWGEVQQQQKLADGFWWYTTAGHGGYIADTNIYPILRKYNTIIYVNSRSNMYHPSEQHFAPFEEDCDWAIPMFVYPALAEANYKRGKYGKEFYETYPTVKHYIQGCIMKTLEQWHPEILINKK